MCLGYTYFLLNTLVCFISSQVMRCCHVLICANYEPNTYTTRKLRVKNGQFSVLSQMKSLTVLIYEDIFQLYNVF